MAAAARQNDIDAAASHWVVRLDRAELTPVEQQDLEAWLAADPRHLGALARAEAQWLDLDRILALERSPAPGAAKAPRWRALPWKAAAMVAMSILGAGASGAFAYDRLAGRQATSVGEIRHIVLDDGTSLVMDTASVVQIRYERGRRRVIVRRGTAGFQVAAGDRRPFIVQAGDLSLDGAGANFAVGVDSAKVAVNVAGGVVQAARRTARGPETCAIGASLRLVSRSDVPLQASRVPEAEMSRELAWRRGLLIFDGERLSEAVARLNRYSRTPIVIEDPALAQRTFVGVFEAGDSRAFARTAATAFNAQVVEADGALRLSRR